MTHRMRPSVSAARGAQDRAAQDGSEAGGARNAQ
jgi:hypothetical protein